MRGTRERLQGINQIGVKMYAKREKPASTSRSIPKLNPCDAVHLDSTRNPPGRTSVVRRSYDLAYKITRIWLLPLMVTVGDVQAFRDVLIDNGQAPKTINHRESRPAA